MLSVLAYALINEDLLLQFVSRSHACFRRFIVSGVYIFIQL